MSLDLDERLLLSRHAALKRRTEGVILVLPEQAIRIGGSGGEILHLCDGHRSGRQIVDAACARHPDDPQVANEVIAFLDEMRALGGLVDATSELHADEKT